MSVALRRTFVGDIEDDIDDVGDIYHFTNAGVLTAALTIARASSKISLTFLSLSGSSRVLYAPFTAARK